MQEGQVCFERVRAWKALQCQRHICEIQGEPCPLELQAAWPQGGLHA